MLQERTANAGPPALRATPPAGAEGSPEPLRTRSPASRRGRAAQSQGSRNPDNACMPSCTFVAYGVTNSQKAPALDATAVSDATAELADSKTRYRALATQLWRRGAVQVRPTHTTRRGLGRKRREMLRSFLSAGVSGAQCPR